MTALFCIVGTTDPDGAGRFGRPAVWPVAFRMTREDAELVLKTCERQQGQFLRELEPVWETIAEAQQPAPRLTYVRQSRDVKRQAGERQRQKLRDARSREAAVCTRFANEMLDPLFPTSTNGSAPHTVVYRILEFWDDPREMGPAALMKLRAELHGLSTEDDDEIEDF